MVEKLAAAYCKVQMGIANGLSGTTGSILDETAFYDAGYMDAQVKRVQKEISSVTKELEVNIDLNDSSGYGMKKKRELMERRERFVFRLVFLASNSFKNLDDCVKIAEGHNYTFMKCVEGLQAYDKGQKEKAFGILESYYKEHKSVEGHFLINKVFGILLAERGQNGKAAPFLTYALQYNPDDIDCLNALKNCYQSQGNREKAAVVGEVLGLLQ